jgi:hypothetical protein
MKNTFSREFDSAELSSRRKVVRKRNECLLSIEPSGHLISRVRFGKQLRRADLSFPGSAVDVASKARWCASVGQRLLEIW